MNRNLLTVALIVMAFINFATGDTNLNQQGLATQLGSDVSGNVQNSADQGERATPEVQPVAVDNEIRQASIRPRAGTTAKPRSLGSTLINLPIVAETLRQTTTPVPLALIEVSILTLLLRGKSEHPSPPALQPVVAETSVPLLQPRPPGLIPNFPPIAETPKPTYFPTSSQKPAPSIYNPPSNPVIAEAPSSEPETATDAL